MIHKTETYDTIDAIVIRTRCDEKFENDARSHG